MASEVSLQGVMVVRVKPASSFVLLFCLVAGAGFLLGGCDDFAFDTLLDGAGTESLSSTTVSKTLAISPTAITVLTTSSVTFTAGGGVSTYTFSVSAGLGSIDESSGVYNALASAGSATVRVTDLAGATSEATVTISATGVLAITSPVVSLPANSSITFNAVGGTPPYSYSIFPVTGSIVAGTGVYTAPAIADTTTVRVTDSAGTPATSDSAVTITAFGGLNIVPSAITLYTNTLYTFTAAGGTGPYSYALTAGTGSIVLATGVYTALGTAGTATVRVTDSLFVTSDATVTVKAPLVIVPLSVSVPADNNFTFSATGGTPGYTYTMESGLGSVVLATGVYTAPGVAGTDEVRVTDADGSASIATITVTAAQPLVIVPSTYITLADGTYTFAAAGGTPPYTYSMVSGGLSIHGVTGLYTAPGAAGVAVVRVTDSAGTPATSDAAITVVDPGPLAISPVSVDIEQGTTYDFSASGGTPLYNWSVTAGLGSVINLVAIGQYTAPVALGTATVRVTDSALLTADAAVTIVPAVPSSLYVDGAWGGPSECRLTWVDNSTDEDGFEIHRRKKGVAYTGVPIATTAANAVSYDDLTCPTPNTIYFYKIRAVKNLPPNVYSAYSSEDADES